MEIWRYGEKHHSLPLTAAPFARKVVVSGRRQRWTRHRFNRGGRRGTQRTPDDDLTTTALCAPLRPPRLIRRRRRNNDFLVPTLRVGMQSAALQRRVTIG